MKALGYSLITAAFLYGSYLTAERTDGVSWGVYFATLAVGVAGVVLVRREIHRASRDHVVIQANIGTIATSLESVLRKMEALDEEKATIDVYALRHLIDRDFPAELDAFVQARESIGHSFGLQAYADVMNPFAAGERYLNRVWSTSTDGYVDEAHVYITMAKEQFAEALAEFRRVSGAEAEA